MNPEQFCEEQAAFFDGDLVVLPAQCSQAINGLRTLAQIPGPSEHLTRMRNMHIAHLIDLLWAYTTAFQEPFSTFRRMQREHIVRSFRRLSEALRKEENHEIVP